VLQAKARLNYCFLFKITLLWQLRFISKSEKEPLIQRLAYKRSGKMKHSIRGEWAKSTHKTPLARLGCP
jgi:hypothetical protein